MKERSNVDEQSARPMLIQICIFIAVQREILQGSNDFRNKRTPRTLTYSLPCPLCLSRFAYPLLSRASNFRDPTIIIYKWSKEHPEHWLSAPPIMLIKICIFIASPQNWKTTGKHLVTLRAVPSRAMEISSSWRVAGVEPLDATSTRALPVVWCSEDSKS